MEQHINENTMAHERSASADLGRSSIVNVPRSSTELDEECRLWILFSDLSSASRSRRGQNLLSYDFSKLVLRNLQFSIVDK